MPNGEVTHKSNEAEERLMDRVRRLAEEAGVPFKETTQPGKRSIVFFGCATVPRWRRAGKQQGIVGDGYKISGAG